MQKEEQQRPRRRRGKKGKEISKQPYDINKSNLTKSVSTSTSNAKSTEVNFQNTENYANSNKFTFHPHQSLLLVIDDEDSPYWYDIGSQIKDRNSTIYNSSKSTPPPSSSSSSSSNHNKQTNPSTLVSHYRNLADQIYKQELKLFQQQNNYNNNSSSSSSDDRWVENTMKRGTLKDKVAAMSVTASQSPIHKMGAGLDALLHLATQAKTSSQQQRVNQLAGEALVDLFTETYLPPNRKLYTLNVRPLLQYYNSSQTLSPRVLLLWRFEELIKEKYSSFLQLLTKWCSTETASTSSSSSSTTMSNPTTIMGITGSSNELQKIMGIKTAAHLLSQRPEGEDRLLNIIVNKIGDPHKKTAAAAGHALRNVLEKHPVMIHVISREVMQLAHRPKLSDKAMYNCIIFLNQLQLKKQSSSSSSDQYRGLASELIQTYFRLFEVAVKHHTHQQSQSQSQSLTQSKSSNGSKKNQNSKSSSTEKSTAAAAMKSRLLSALLTGVNRAHPFLPESESLQDKERIDALYRIAHLTSSPGTATQALMLLYHLAIGVAEMNNESLNENNEYDNDKDSNKKSSPTSSSSSATARKDRFYRTLYSTLASPTMLCQGGTKHHLTLYFNLLYKSMKRDTIPLRVLAFSKRLLYTVMHAVENACGVQTAALFLLSEVGRFQPILKTFHIVHHVSHNTNSESEENKRMEFDPSKRDPRMAFGTDDKNNNKTTTTAVEETSNKMVQSESLSTSTSTTKLYNLQMLNEPGKNIWEVTMLAQHFHPSVRKFAESFMDQTRGNVIDYGGDPLRDFSLMPFLDRFAYRHPKSRSSSSASKKIGEEENDGDGGTTSTTTIVMKKQNKIMSSLSVPVNDEKFWNARMGKKVAVENEFFRKFFVERARRDAAKGIVRGNGTDGVVDPDALLDEAIANSEDRVEGVNQKLDEDGWDTDPEEEAFANDLAEKFMESAGNGKANFDNEDPDMEGWDDMYSDADDDDDDGDADGKEENVDFSKMDGIQQLNDDASDDDDASGLNMIAHDNEEEGDDVFMDADEVDNFDSDDDDDDDQDDEFYSTLAQEEDDDSADDENENSTKERLKTSKKARSEDILEQNSNATLSSSFQDADEYAELIAKSWKEREGSKEKNLGIENETPETKETSIKDVISDSSAKKRKRRRKSKNK